MCNGVAMAVAMKFQPIKEQPLDAWVYEVMGVINDIIYNISTKLNHAVYEVRKDVN